MSAVCPACGVGVVPGMVRCPKCGAGLPRSKRAATQIEGGTALPSAGGGMPSLPLMIGGGLVVAVIVFLALRGGKPAKVAPADAGAEEVVEATTTAAPRRAQEAEIPSAPAAATAVDPGPSIRAIEAGLRRDKLWGTVTLTSDRVDVRSGGCADPAMGPIIDGATAGLHEAGVTSLRCLDQGGAVVFERGL